MVSPNDQPAWNAARLACRISGTRANFVFRNVTVPSVGRLYSQDSRPRANMFFARSASFLVMSMPLSASTVIEVRPTACTV